jgi:hypothetical protein
MRQPLNLLARRPARLVAKLVSALALGAAGAALVATPAAAQVAAALGKPLPSPDLDVGTVSVRVVAGSAASPVVGTDVTLVVNNTPRVARTDSAGRATFPGLPVGAKVVARVVNDDKEEKLSEAFQIPDTGGMRVMLTTKPWQGGAGGAPFAGGGGGMPNPRQMSGEGRSEQADPAGMLTVRLAYDDFKDSPAGVPVALIGYSADDSTSFRVVRSDAGGRAQFTDLDRSGGTSYFAMTLLPRNGAIDRLTSGPTVLESQFGVRMILSSEKRDSKAPPIDDLAKADPQVPTEAGKVRVLLEGVADLTATVTLIDAETRKSLGELKPEIAPPDPSRIQGGAQFQPDPKLPAGTLDIEVTGGPGQVQDPLKGIAIRIVPASAKDASTGGFESVTAADGTVRMALKVTEPQRAAFEINGRQLASQPFDIAKTGGKLTIRAQWPDSGRPQVVFDVPASAGRVFYAECVFMGQHYRSMPFQLLEATGTKISVFAYPRVMFGFQLHMFVEDQLLAAQGRFEITNNSWAPFRAGPDGMVVPLPRGFKGGVVFDPDQNEVAVAAGEGFRIVRPIPPFGRAFHGGFSMTVDDGKVDWSLDLPHGTWDSQLDIRQTPGLVVHTPPNVKGEVKTAPQGTFFVVDNIRIAPRQAMVMSIEGLPTPPAWRAWLSRIIGVLVVAVMLGGVAFALFGKRPAATAAAVREARRQRLLDELVQLERAGGSSKRREQVLRELEELWS